ncbi:MAG TPA: hypothetical protein VN726_06380 [Hanamia sp.]|nr:hypothetical protein [Hanamia sp.]
MKKILFLFTFMAFSLLGICQSFNHTASNPTGAILNTSSDTMNFSTAKSYSVVAIQPVVTKATGTMAGKSYLYTSLDGVNYVINDSLVLGNVTTNSNIWVKANPPYVYWRIVTGGATTVTGTTSAKFVGKNP